METVLRLQVRNGEYRSVVTFLDHPEGYLNVPVRLVCCLERVICTLLADECQCRPGEAPEAPRRRAAAIMEAGALELAAATAVNNVGGCYSATSAACRLVTELTALRVVSAATLRQCARLDIVGAMLRVLTADPSGAVNLDNALTPLALCWAYRGLMGAVGAPWTALPHTKAAAAAAVAVPSEHTVEALRAAVVAFALPSIVIAHVLNAGVLLEQCEVHSRRGKGPSQLMRAAGGAFRWILAGWVHSMALHSMGDAIHAGVTKSLGDVGAAMRSRPQSGALQQWGITYAFQPIVFMARLRDHRRSHFAFGFCRGRCCIDMRADISGNGIPELLLAISAPSLATSAVRMHACCVRPAARLMAWSAVGCPAVQRKLIEAGADAVLSAVAARAAQRGSQRRAPPARAAADADADEEEEVGSDGECLSEWGNDDIRGQDEALVNSASTQALVARAQRAIAGVDAAVATQCEAAAVAAANAAAAALLAELESESKGASGGAAAGGKSKGKKSKSKKKSAKNAKNATTAVAAPASDESDNDGDDKDNAGGDDDDDDIARLLSTQQGRRAAVKPPAPIADAPAPAPAPVAAAVPLPPPRREAQSPAPAPARVVAAAPVVAAPPLPCAAPLPQAAPPPRAPKLRLSAVGCACGDAACAQPQPHAAPPPQLLQLSSAAAVEALFPWLSMADEAAPAAESQHEVAAPAVDAPHEDDDLCVICLDAPRDTPLAGCAYRHPAALCADCARRLLAPGGAQPAVCPLCRAPAVPV